VNVPRRVTVVEVGPRDGLQNEAVTLSVDDRALFCERLLEAGLRVVEVGAFVSPEKVPQMAGSDEVFQRGGNGPADVRRVVLRHARQGLEGARVVLLRVFLRALLLAEGMDHGLDHRRLPVVEHGHEHPDGVAGEGVQLAEDLGAGHPVGGGGRAAELRSPLEHFARAEGMQRLDRDPARIVVLLPSDDRKQLIDGMHAAMLP